MLSEPDLKLARELVAGVKPGRYTLKALYGDQWQFQRRPRRFGWLLKLAILAGRVPGIRWLHRNSSRHQVYEVIRQAPLLESLPSSALIHDEQRTSTTTRTTS